jgi:small-conductance mechanosensitive channel
LILGRLVQAFIFTAMLIIGLDQFGIEVTFLITLLTVVAGTVLVGFSIAFGLGARAHVSNLIAARTAQSVLQAGMIIRICGVEGTVLEVSTSHISLETETGLTLIPATMIDENMVEILTVLEEA